MKNLFLVYNRVFFFNLIGNLNINYVNKFYYIANIP